MTELWRRWWCAHPHARVVAPGLVLLVVGLVGFLGVLDSVRERDDLTVLDEPVLTWLVAHRSGALTGVLSAITFASGPVVLPIVVGVGALGWGVVSRSWWRPLLVVGAMVVSTVVSLGVKSSVARPRPPEVTMVIPGAETTFSFPSGHTIGTATLALVLGYVVVSRRRTVRAVVGWSVGALVAIALVALSRLYLGYHFLTDVLAAGALAVATLGLVVLADRLARPRPPTTPQQAVREGTATQEKCPQQDSNLQPTD